MYYQRFIFLLFSSTILLSPHTSSGHPPSRVLEAENAMLKGAIRATNQSGFTGKGFVDFINNHGDYVEWTIDIRDATSATVCFRYANGVEATRIMALVVNGSAISVNVSFPSTKKWSSWAMSRPLSIHLKQGSNKIRLVANGSSGPNVDHLLLSIVDTPQGTVMEAEAGKLKGAQVAFNHPGFTSVGFVDFVHPAGDCIEWAFNNTRASKLRLAFRYANGGESSRWLQLQINGMVVNDRVEFPSTRSWTEWQNKAVEVVVKPGPVKVKLVANGSAGPNIDHLAWSYIP